jgi:hypothetical protein
MAEAPVHRDMAKLFGSCFAEKHFLIRGIARSQATTAENRSTKAYEHALLAAYSGRPQTIFCDTCMHPSI